MLRFVLALSLMAAAAEAQSSVAVTVNFSGTGQSITFGTATGSIAPLGTASMTLTGTPTSLTTGTLVFVFTFGNGDTLTTSAPITIGSTTIPGIATVTGGTGAFLNATGTFNFIITVNTNIDPNPFTLSGSGTVVLATGSGTLPTVVCEGGSGGTLPILAEHPNASVAPAVCSVIICANGSGGTLPVTPAGGQQPRDTAAPAATCTNANLDVAGVQGGSTLPVLVFEGGGSTSPVLAFLSWCNGCGTLPVLTFEGGGSTLPVLAYDGGGSGGTVTPEHPAATTVTPPGNALEIATPLQATAATYSATAQCNGAPATCWLTVPVAAGSIAASSRAAITAYVNPQGQPAGVYTGTVTVAITPKSGTATTVSVPVTMLVPPPGPAMALSQTGVHLTAQAGTGTLSQSITVINQGSGTLTFTATATALAGGNWLSVSPTSGTAPAAVTLRANPAGLAPGTYFGRVDFSPSGIANATQSVEVALTVLPPTATPDATIAPTGLIFLAGGPAQTVQVSTPTSRALTITTSLAFASGTGWFSAKLSGSAVTVTPNAAGLAAGVYIGTLDIHIAETKNDHVVTVVLIVPAKAPCTATQTLPVVTNLEGNFSVAAGFPVPLLAQVVDNCGVPLTNGAVMAYFPQTGDPAVPLIPLGQGLWSGTWMPHTLAGGAATVGIMASGASVFGSTGVVGTLTANATAPLAFAGGVVNAASIVDAAIAPGSFFSIFGSNLALALASAPGFPYPATLSDTQVFLGGEVLPLEVAAGGQINAVIPYDASINTVQQLMVQRNGTFSMPEPVLLSAAQPAVFTLDQSGKGPGAIVVIKPDGTQFVNGPSKPATAGDFLVIYGTGLGAVLPGVTAGAAAPASPLSHTVDPVVTIGGKPAQLLFAGLTPGYTGLYQINVVVPAGITARPDVPVVVTLGAAASPVVTVAIQ